MQDYQYIKFVMDVFSKFYPGSLGRCWIVDAPYIFRPCWAVLSRLVDPVLLQAVKFVTVTELRSQFSETAIDVIIQVFCCAKHTVFAD